MALLQSSLPPLCPNSVQIQTRRSPRSAANHGLTALARVSRAVGAENFNIQYPISNFQGNSRNHFSRQVARLRKEDFWRDGLRAVRGIPIPQMLQFTG